MIRFHLDELLIKNGLSINSFTNLLNEDNEDETKNISRKSITAIANNTAKNIQISVVERILDFFNIPLSELMTVENIQYKYVFTLSYEELNNYKMMFNFRDSSALLPNLYFEIFERNELIKRFSFDLIINIDENISTNQKGYINAITFLPILSTPPYNDENERELFENSILNDIEKSRNDQYEELSNYFCKLTVEDIENIFKPLIDSILNFLKGHFSDDIELAKTFYFDISGILVVPLVLNVDNNKIDSDFSLFNGLSTFNKGIYKNISTYKTVLTEYKIVKK
ncbi:helix-turn-helix domain-containing protein [Enterococcus italicus]|uniref:helix-turn-helix domain-containing protein n=1 Tax=Enterococcus italicus TaxID=246144 RepID=UPI003F48934F